MNRADIHVGRQYVGGHRDATVSVRRVECLFEFDGHAPMVLWRDRFGSGSCHLDSFAAWARHEFVSETAIERT